jgi:hypothetical protein
MRALATSIFLLALAGAACATDIPNHKGWPISRARIALMESGWKPVPKEQKWVRYDYPETEECSMGPAYCWLDYVKDRRCLRVLTKGEFAPIIIGWQFECRPHERAGS